MLKFLEIVAICSGKSEFSRDENKGSCDSQAELLIVLTASTEWLRGEAFEVVDDRSWPSREHQKRLRTTKSELDALRAAPGADCAAARASLRGTVSLHRPSKRRVYEALRLTARR